MIPNSNLLTEATFLSTVDLNKAHNPANINLFMLKDENILSIIPPGFEITFGGIVLIKVFL